MFQDAPLYQMYNERVARREHGAKTSVRVSSDDISQTNSLEFQDTNFTLIDDEDPTVHPGGKPDINLLASVAFDLWRQRASAAAAASTAFKPPLSSPKRERSKSPELKIADNRARSRSPEARSPTLNSVVKRTPSEPVEMQRFAAQIAGTGPKRVSWSNMPQVVEKRLAENLTPVQKKLQESLFEIMTSEASYFRSLNVLIEVFYRAPCMQAGTEGALVTHTEKHHLFSNILEIIMTSESFLRAMEGCFRKDPWLTNLLEIVYKYSEADFQAYVTYVQNQTYQNRTLCKLRQHPAFLEATKQLQTHPECAFLDLNSFLLLPMQRVMRLRLLTSTVLHYAPMNSAVYRSGLVALASLELLLAECDSKKLYMEQKERLMELTIRFEYKLDAKSVATESRRLIKEGELRLVTVTKQTSSAFQRRLSGIRRQKVVSASLFLFNDLLIIAKQRSNKKLMVDDSCPLTAITTQANGTPAGAVITRYYNSQQSKEDEEFSSFPTVTDRKDSLYQSSSDMEGFAVYPFSLFIESPDHPKAEYKLQAKSLSERERWLDALYCPQLLAKRSYAATAGDELELREGDTAYLLVRLSDGWCKGMLPDGRKGWFPTSVCDEMNDATIKRENMKNCLLMEEARNAYKRRKAKENFIEFRKVKVVNAAKQNGQCLGHDKCTNLQNPKWQTVIDFTASRSFEGRDDANRIFDNGVRVLSHTGNDPSEFPP
ncbi:RhoGEF domain protein [Opisthorchis viverrini]|uniref:RhoGEF domain protein n=1 Tax=Opisthorchis viverrini TaxID=6198 RepID=A0A1S8WYE0_OPIVI|nr:RhoGEF domain protein [Opisthorchis viverrini]